MIQIIEKAHDGAGEREWGHGGELPNTRPWFHWLPVVATLQDLFPAFSTGLCTTFLHTLVDYVKVFLLYEKVYFYKGTNTI